jgi:hypothetical protein
MIGSTVKFQSLHSKADFDYSPVVVLSVFLSPSARMNIPLKRGATSMVD